MVYKIIFLILLMVIETVGCTGKPYDEYTVFPEYPQVEIPDLEHIWYSGIEIDEPFVRILEPLDGDAVDENYLLLFSAHNITYYEIYDNDTILRQAYQIAPYYDITLNLDSSEPHHNITVKGFDEFGQYIVSDSITVLVMPGMDLSKGYLVGDMWISYYYLTEEAKVRGDKDIMIGDMNCEPLAMISYDFLKELCMEGSGKLEEGTILNYGSRCKCGFPCPWGGNICYVELDSNQYPWGAGTHKRPLEPFRSVAVDKNFIASGSILYIEEFDGIYFPYIDGIGNFTHDGCFRADDVGGWIKNDHFDFFSGTREYWLYLEKIIPTRKRLTVRVDAGRCSYLKN